MKGNSYSSASKMLKEVQTRQRDIKTTEEGDDEEDEDLRPSSHLTRIVTTSTFLHNYHHPLSANLPLGSASSGQQPLLPEREASGNSKLSSTSASTWNRPESASKSSLLLGSLSKVAATRPSFSHLLFIQQLITTVSVMLIMPGVSATATPLAPLGPARTSEGRAHLIRSPNLFRGKAKFGQSGLFRESRAKEIASRLADLKRQLEDELVSVDNNLTFSSAYSGLNSGKKAAGVNKGPLERVAVEAAANDVQQEHQVALGSPCINSSHCNRAIENSQCDLSNFTCSCLSLHIPFNSTTCLKPSLLGYECLIDAQCTKKVANSFCSNGLCTCHAKFASFRKDKCLPAGKINDYCLSDRQCQMGDKHSHCKWKIRHVYGLCKCPPNYKAITRDEDGFTRCLPRLGDSCTSSLECLLATPNSLCREPRGSDSLRIGWQSSGISTRRCYCDSGFRESSSRLTCERLLENSTPPFLSPSSWSSFESINTEAGGRSSLQTGEAAAPATSGVVSRNVELAQNSSMDAKHKYELVVITTDPTQQQLQKSVTPPTQTGANQEFEVGAGSVREEPHEAAASTPRSEQLPQQPVTGAYKASSLGKACSVTRECQLSDPNSECKNGICDCSWPESQLLQRQQSFKSNSSDLLLLLESDKQVNPAASSQPVHFSGCAANSTGCYEDTFQCQNGQCISWYFVCDSYRNCADGSDEQFCSVGGAGGGPSSLSASADSFDIKRPYCPPEAFQCDDGACLQRGKLCNGRRECLDGSDELNCNSTPPSPLGNSTRRVEASSASSYYCHPQAFRCDSGQCVPGYAFCNAVTDCADGSDESERYCERSVSLTYPGHSAGSSATTHHHQAHQTASSRRARLLRERPSSSRAECPSWAFTCANGKCRSSAILCSGIDGCGDNSDEQRCQVCRCPGPPKLAVPEFQRQRASRISAAISRTSQT